MATSDSILYATQLPLFTELSFLKLSKADHVIIEGVQTGQITVDTVNGLVYRRDGQLARGKPNHDGYIRVSVTSHEKYWAQVFVHRLVAYALWGDEMFRWEVNHINEIKADNRAENLELVDHDYNMQYSMNGAKNHMTKLSPSDIYEIRRRFKFRGGTDSGKALAEEFGVCKQTICNILQGKIWRHV